MSLPESWRKSGGVGNGVPTRVRHWNAKFNRDSELQGVTDPRFAVLLKNRARNRFVYVEYEYPLWREEEYPWRWSRETQLGLKGFNGEANAFFKWYPHSADMPHIRTNQNCSIIQAFELTVTFPKAR